MAKTPTQELVALIERSGLNQTTAAAALGMTPRAIRHYLAGDRPVPLVVILAMRWIAQETRKAS